MNLKLIGTKVTQDVQTFAFQKNNLVDNITVEVDTDESWQYKLDIQYARKDCSGKTLYNIINLNRTGNICTAQLTTDMLPFNGRYIMQLRAINGNKIQHSDTFNAWVEYSVEPGSTYVDTPSEFYQIEQNITEINNNPPYPGPNGYWMIWNPDTHQYEQSNKPIPDGSLPDIDESTNGKYLTNDGEKSYWADVQGGSSESKIDKIEVNSIEQPIIDKVVQIVISKDTIGLNNVNNTSDADKPISIQTQAALNKKQDVINVNGLLKGDETGAVSQAEAGIDYIAPDAISQLLGTSADKIPSEKAVSDAIASMSGGDMLQSVYDPSGVVKDAGGIPSYVEANGGKIDAIQVNGETQDIVNKKVNIIVPTNVSELNNDSKYITNEALSDYATKAELPTKTSQLENDSNFINESALDGYVKTVDMPTKISQLENDAGYVTIETAPVKSVNGQIGNVKIDIPKQYELPVATAETLGGIKADAKTEEQTVPVGIDVDGKLWVHIEGGSSIDTILADKVMFDGDMVFTEQFGKYEPSGGKVTIPSDGKSLKELLLDAYSEDKNPVITQPSVGITSPTARAYEVGTVVTPQYSGSFNAGKYEYGPTPTGVSVTEWQVTNNVTAETRATQAGSFATYTVPDGSNYRITIKATYSDGMIPVTALGAQYEVGKISASSKSAQSGAISSYRNSFYGTLADKSVDVTNSIIRGLQQKSNKTLANGNTFTVNVPIGAEAVLIAYPATLRDVTSIKDVNGLNADITSAFVGSTIDVTGANEYTAISYKLYKLDYAKPNDVANKYTVTI